METIGCTHVRIPKRNGKGVHVALHERRVAWQHAFLTKQWIQGQLAKDLLVFIVVRMLQRCTGALGECHKDVVRVIETMCIGSIKGRHHLAMTIPKTSIDPRLRHAAFDSH